MPKLRSGREFALSISPIIDGLHHNEHDAVAAWVTTFRLEVSAPRDLLPWVPIGYFHDGHGGPDGLTYDSGLRVRDVVDGRADWTPEEVEEFRQWISTHRRLDDWLAECLQDINEAIRALPIWNDPGAHGEK